LSDLPVDFTASELAALPDAVSFTHLLGRQPAAKSPWPILSRHVQPLEEAGRRLRLGPTAMSAVRSTVIRTMASTASTYSTWDATTWITAARSIRGNQFAAVICVAHALGCVSALDAIGAGVEPTSFARRLFGRDAVALQQQRVVDQLRTIGYCHHHALVHSVPSTTSRLLIVAGECRLEAVTTEHIRDLHAAAGNKSVRGALHKISRALHGLGFIEASLRPSNNVVPRTDGIDPEWLGWTNRWRATSTLSKQTRDDVYYSLRRTGRWLAQCHPDVRSPQDWTKELAAEFVAEVNGWKVGSFTSGCGHLSNRGEALQPATKDGVLRSIRAFFRDCREWGWWEARFDPQRALATPRSVRALQSRNPRIIADDVWAKLIWAGLNLSEPDLPKSHGGPLGAWHAPTYPLPMVKALAITWLFAGLRVDELVRLRVGCIRWQSPVGGPGAAPAPDLGATCLLDVPVHKTGSSFSKPVDPVVGRFVGEWEAVRSTQPALPDRKTGELVPMLFTWRGRQLYGGYINGSLIPTLCEKAGVPLSDARGRITGHRARHTIASQLYNSKEPMTLFELQNWLGHRQPSSTQYYVRISPTKLTKAYTDAGYFARNIRAIKVLLDREAITAGGNPWQYFDLGHGYCTYNFFEQCRHRMACARCDFYVPKDSARVQLLEAKANLQRMVMEIPLTEEERAAVEDGQAAVDRLLGRLANVPTPAGPTPRQLGRQLPVINHLPEQGS
jgi:integrase